jgi:hypothetical protein
MWSKTANERRVIRNMFDGELLDFIKRQDEITRECPNPTPANARRHQEMTDYARAELRRRQLAVTASRATCGT